MQRKCLKCDYNFTHCNRSENYSLLPRLEVTSSPTNTPHLTHSDVDLHMPYDINFNYYNSHEFHDNPDIAQAKKKICGFPVSRPYLAFGRRNPNPKLFYWIMPVSVST